MAFQRIHLSGDKSIYIEVTYISQGLFASYRVKMWNDPNDSNEMNSIILKETFKK